MMWPFRKKQSFKYSELELSCVQSFVKGFELGLQVSSEFDEKARTALKNEAIEEALGRMNGNDKTNN